MTTDQQEEVIISLPEDLENVQDRFGRPSDQVTVDDVQNSNRYIDKDSWDKVVRRAEASKFPLVAKLHSGAVAVVRAAPKREIEFDTGTLKKAKLEENGSHRAQETHAERDGNSADTETSESMATGPPGTFEGLGEASGQLPGGMNGVVTEAGRVDMTNDEGNSLQYKGRGQGQYAQYF